MENRILTPLRLFMASFACSLLLSSCLKETPLELPEFQSQPFTHISLGNNSLTAGMQYTLEPNKDHLESDSSAFKTIWKLRLQTTDRIVYQETIEGSTNSGHSINTQPGQCFEAAVLYDGVEMHSEQLIFPKKPQVLNFLYDFKDTLNVLGTGGRFSLLPVLNYESLAEVFRITYTGFDQEGNPLPILYIQDTLNLGSLGVYFTKINERELKGALEAFMDTYVLRYEGNDLRSFFYSKIEVCVANVSSNHIDFEQSLIYPEDLDYLIQFTEMTYSSFDKGMGFFGLYNDTCFTVDVW